MECSSGRTVESEDVNTFSHDVYTVPEELRRRQA